MIGVRGWLVALLMLVVGPARALDVLDVSPLQATPQDMIRMNVHFNAGQELEAVHTYRYGSSIQVYVILNDVVTPGAPPVPAHTERFDLGRFPIGEYLIEVYNGNLSGSPPLVSYALGVGAAAPIPATSKSGLLALVGAVLAVGFVAARRRRNFDA